MDPAQVDGKINLQADDIHSGAVLRPFHVMFPFYRSLFVNAAGFSRSTEALPRLRFGGPYLSGTATVTMRHHVSISLCSLFPNPLFKRLQSIISHRIP